MAKRKSKKTSRSKEESPVQLICPGCYTSYDPNVDESPTSNLSGCLGNKRPTASSSMQLLPYENFSPSTLTFSSLLHFPHIASSIYHSLLMPDAQSMSSHEALEHGISLYCKTCQRHDKRFLEKLGFQRMKPFFECVRVCKIGGTIIYNAYWIPKSKFVKLKEIWVRQDTEWSNTSIISVSQKIKDTLNPSPA